MLKGLKLGGRRGLDPTMAFTRFVPIASFHHPGRACWLWAISLRRCVADEHRALRYVHLPGEQASYQVQFWAWSLVFQWQEAGRYVDNADRLRSRLSRLFGIEFKER